MDNESEREREKRENGGKGERVERVKRKMNGPFLKLSIAQILLTPS